MLPRYSKVHIEISNVCNLKCSFCPEVERKKGFLSPGEFRHILAQVAPLADQVALHLMGEPLLHPDLPKLIDITEEHETKIFFVSNGVLLRESLAQQLLRPAFRQVNFSLHSFRDNFGDADPNVYLKRIFRFVESALNERPDLYINFRLWNLNDPRGMGADNQSMLAAIFERFGSPAKSLVDVRNHKSVLIKNRLYLHFDSEFTWPSLSLPYRGDKGRCHGLSSHFGILVDGTVVPCCLDKEGIIPLGNVHSESLLSILAKPRARAMVQGFAEGRLVEDLCQRCPYIDRFGRPISSPPKGRKRATIATDEPSTTTKS